MLVFKNAILCLKIEKEAHHRFLKLHRNGRNKNLRNLLNGAEKISACFDELHR